MEPRSKLVIYCALIGALYMIVLLAIGHAFAWKGYLPFIFGVPPHAVAYLPIASGVATAVVAVLFRAETFGPGDGFMGGMLSYLLFVPIHGLLVLTHAEGSFGSPSALNSASVYMLGDLTLGVVTVGWPVPIIGAGFGAYLRRRRTISTGKPLASEP